MNHLSRIGMLLLASSSALPASAQARKIGAADGAESLRTARRTFVAADEGRDGMIGSKEASAASIPALDFQTFDADGDGRFSLDEFLVYYSRLLVNSGKELGSELGREVARIQTTRGASASAEARRPPLEEGVRPAAGPHVAAQLERARRALESGRSGSVQADLSPSGRAGKGPGTADDPAGIGGLTTEERLRRARAALEIGRDRAAPDHQAEGALSDRAIAPGGIDRDLVREQLARARRALEHRERAPTGHHGRPGDSD